MTSDAEFEAQWRKQAARAVERARAFGQTYFMMPDGTLVLRADHERWVQEDREIARRLAEYQSKREVEMLHSKPWGVIILFALGLIAVVGFLFFY